MVICVCGWYYYPSYYSTLFSIQNDYDIMVVMNQPGDVLSLPHVRRENIGLEWGAYSFYLDKLWDGKSDVLFTQDDVEVKQIGFFEWCSTITEDICFLFQNEREASYNGTAHGRMFFATARFLETAKELGGFYYDKGNRGFIAKAGYRTEKPPDGCRHHNAGIHSFTSFVPRIRKHNPKIRKRTYLCDTRIKLGRRGKF